MSSKFGVSGLRCCLLARTSFLSGVVVVGFMVICWLAAAPNAQAQRWEIGGWAGVAHYFGDLNPDFSLKRPGAAGGGIARYNFNERIAGKVSLNYGRISGYDSDSPSAFQRARNLSFRSDILDATAQLEFNFLPYQHGSRDDLFSPYVFLGGGVFSFNPQTQFEGKWVALQPLGTEGQYIGSEYSLTQPQLAYGLGLKWDFTRDWCLNVELSARQLFTDYLDDVSGNYTSRANLRSLRGDLAVALADRSIGDAAPIGRQNRMRGNGINNDTYMFLSIGLLYNFNSVRCFDF